MSDIRNFEEYRRQVLDSLGEDYTVEDLRNFERWRLKVLHGLGGSGKIYSTLAVTDSASGSIASITDGADGLPVKSLNVNIAPKQSGSGDPSPSNVRPITGWDEVEVVNDPKYGGNIEFNQLYRRSVGSSTDKGLTAILTEVDGITTITGTPTDTGHAFGKAVRLTKNHIIYACGNSSDPSKIRFSSQAFGADDGNGFIFKYTQPTGNWYFTSQVMSITTINVTMHPMVIDLTQMFGETKANEIYTMSQADAVAYIKSLFYKDYYPYNTGETTTVSAVNGDPYGYYPIPLPSTVYGGTLDVVRGKLVKFPYYSSYNGETLNGEWICDRAVYSQGTTPPSGSQVVDMSGSGTEIDLTPIEVKSLLGNNNIYSDAGTVEVEYRADTKKYVDKKIAETQAMILENIGG